MSVHHVACPNLIDAYAYSVGNISSILSPIYDCVSQICSYAAEDTNFLSNITTDQFWIH